MFIATDPSTHQGKSNTWYTPEIYISSLGKFDLDPCTMSTRPFNTAIVHYEHDLGVNGLSERWFGRVWLNPPYGKEMEPFVDKFIQHQDGLCLIFARMGNKSVQKLIRSRANFFFLRKRIKFISELGSHQTNAGTDSCLVFYNEKEKQRIEKSGLDGVFLYSH